MPFPNVSDQQLFSGRCAYTYPTVAIAGSLGEYAPLAFNSTQDLEIFLHGHLHSNDPEEKILGYLGVIYWGHVSGQAGMNNVPRALGKVRLALYGATRIRNGNEENLRGILGPMKFGYGVMNAAEILTSAKVEIDWDRYGSALRLLCKLPWIDVAFGSKICAFLEPGKCGVIDKVITDRYPEFGFGKNRKGYVKRVNENFIRYDEYCRDLQDRAIRMNQSQYPRWRDIDGMPYEWRAVDIERALFKIEPETL